MEGGPRQWPFIPHDAAHQAMVTGTHGEVSQPTWPISAQHMRLSCTNRFFVLELNQGIGSNAGSLGLLCLLPRSALFPNNSNRVLRINPPELITVIM